MAEEPLKIEFTFASFASLREQLQIALKVMGDSLDVDYAFANVMKINKAESKCARKVWEQQTEEYKKAWREKWKALPLPAFLVPSENAVEVSEEACLRTDAAASAHSAVFELARRLREESETKEAHNG